MPEIRTADRDVGTALEPADVPVDLVALGSDGLIVHEFRLTLCVDLKVAVRKVAVRHSLIRILPRDGETRLGIAFERLHCRDDVAEDRDRRAVVRALQDDAVLKFLFQIVHGGTVAFRIDVRFFRRRARRLAQKVPVARICHLVRIRKAVRYDRLRLCRISRTAEEVCRRIRKRSEPVTARDAAFAERIDVFRRDEIPRPVALFRIHGISVFGACLGKRRVGALPFGVQFAAHREGGFLAVIPDLNGSAPLRIGHRLIGIGLRFRHALSEQSVLDAAVFFA